MADQADNTDGIVIKIPPSFLEKHDDQRKGASKATHDYDFFTRTNIGPIQVKRYTEHGTTEVQSLAFYKADQRVKVLELLNDHGLYNRLPNLLDCVYQLGCESDDEKRHYAALAVSELANKQPFLDLKEAAILPWAKDDNPEVRKSAAVALSQLLKQERNKAEVLTLLKHWISLDNPLLTDSALSTYFLIAKSQPDETLEAIRAIIESGKILQYQLVDDLFGTDYDLFGTVSGLFRIVYRGFPILAVKQLYSWLLPVTDSDLCRVAGMLSLICVQLDDAAEDEDTRKKVVEMIFTLWGNPRMPFHEIMQEETTVLMEKWASEAVEKMNKALSPGPTLHQAFFHDLYKKFEGRRNPLDFYLQKWEKDGRRKREREQLRNSRGGKGGSSGPKDRFSYRDLLPQDPGKL